MPDATFLAISTAQSSAALAAAHQAQERACEMMVKTYNAASASVDEMRQYAECIDVLYPDPLTADELFYLRGLLAVCFIGAFYRAYWLWKEECDTGSVFIGFFLGFVATGVGVVLLAGLYLAAKIVLGF